MQKQNTFLLLLMAWLATGFIANGNLPENENLVCTASAGTFQTTMATVCPGEIYTASVTGNETAAGYVTVFLLTDPGGNILESSASGSFNMPNTCGEIFNIAAYNYQVGSGANENPATLGDIDCAVGCCDLVSGLTVEVGDFEQPIFDWVPWDDVIECLTDLPPPEHLIFTDNCTQGDPVIPEEVVLGDPCGGTVERTWAAFDMCGNAAFVVQQISIMDTTPPFADNIPADIVVECVQDVPDPTMVTFSDNCSFNVTVNYTDGPVSGNCPATMERIWTGTDECGNMTTEIQFIQIEDYTAPVIDAPPADVTMFCDEPLPAPVDLFFTDNCGASGLATYTDTPASEGCPSIVTRVWEAVDECGNISSVTQNIILVDNTPPVIDNVPADITLSCGANVPPPVTLSYSDNCGGDGMVTSTDSSNGGLPEIITRTWTATDVCNNVTTAVQQITLATESQNPNDVKVENGDVYVEDSCKGVILKAPNGNCYRIVVDNTGQLITEAVACP